MTLRSDPEKTRAWQQRSRKPLPAVSASKLRDEVEYQEARRVVMRRAGYVCEARVEGVCTGRGQHAHHVVRRSQIKGHNPELMLWTCFACHDWIHGNVDDARALGLLKSAPGPAGEVPAKAPLTTRDRPPDPQELLGRGAVPLVTMRDPEQWAALESLPYLGALDIDKFAQRSALPGAGAGRTPDAVSDMPRLGTIEK